MGKVKQNQQLVAQGTSLGVSDTMQLRAAGWQSEPRVLQNQKNHSGSTSKEISTDVTTQFPRFGL